MLIKDKIMEKINKISVVLYCRNEANSQNQRILLLQKFYFSVRFSVCFIHFVHFSEYKSYAREKRKTNNGLRKNNLHKVIN